uniref:proteasome endopeptidase complex n=1 Tax=Lygus hesperus TaxID=30085 RepID=A0A0A9WBW6_LYGHE
MAGVHAIERKQSGFNFDNCKRNLQLVEKGFAVPRAQKTGTTIVGALFAGGVVLGADTRATEGPIVADKNCDKIHYLAKNMYCCGAGTAADTVMVTGMISSQLELHRMMTRRTVPVVTASRMLKQLLFRYQGHIGAALVLGGYDLNGPHLYSIHPHGSTDKLPYVTMGSGSLAAMSVLESRWRPNLGEEEAKKLVRDAVAGGVFNDLGSGSHVDLCVISKDKVDYLRPYDIANVKGQKQGKYLYPRGTTGTLTTKIIPLVVESTEVRTTEGMDTD